MMRAALGEHGFQRALADKALRIAKEQGKFTVFAVVDALTRIAQKAEFTGDRVEADAKAATLLAALA